METIKTKVSDLRAGDVIVKKSGEHVRITGIADKPAEKRTLIIGHQDRFVLDEDKLVEKVVQK